MMGSPKYMSPEQVGGHPVDHRSDVFSLGVLLYEMLAGQPAFSDPNLGALLNAILRSSPKPLAELRPDAPASLELVIARAMQKNPGARYQDAAEMARDLAQCRTLIARARSGAGAAAQGGADPFAATVVGDATQLVDRPPEGLGLSPLFDSTAGLERLLHPQGEMQPVVRKPPLVRVGWLAWAAAYLVAGAGAVAIALG
jgi:serine/threonine-protein kinase